MSGAMERFQVKNSIYPLLCILSSLCFLVGGMVLARRTFFPLFLLEIVILYVLFGYGRAVLGALAVFVPVSLLFVLMAQLINRDASIAVAMGCRVLLVGLCAVPALGLPHVKLIRNLNQLRCPKMLTLGMLITLRFVPLVAEEVAQIREALKTRCVSASRVNCRGFYRAQLSPLRMRLTNISDTMALSLETRGFALDDSPVTIYEPVHFTLRDGVYVLCMVALLAANALLLV